MLEVGFEPTTIALLVTFAQRQNFCRYKHEALTTELHERILNPVTTFLDFDVSAECPMIT